VLGSCGLPEIERRSSIVSPRKVTVAFDVPRYVKYPHFPFQHVILRFTSPVSSIGRAPTLSSFVPSLSSKESNEEESYPTARVLFDFTATSEFELDISGIFILDITLECVLSKPTVEGATVHVVEPDDGSGWVKVSNDRGRQGLVPASYLEHGTAPSPQISPSRGSSQYGNCPPA
jgi:hypothetical protein